MRADDEVMVFGSSGVGWTPWDEAPEHLREHYRAEARAACLAMIEAWPGASRESDQLGGNWHRIILPLTENPND